MPIDLTVYNAYWTFTTQSGIIGDGPTMQGLWKYAGGAPSPSNIAVCRGQGTISQSFTVSSPGTHTIACRAQLSWWQNGTQTFVVKVDGASIGTSTGVGQFAWTTKSYTVSLTAGTHTLSFEGQAVSGTEQFFLDTVTVTGPSGAVTLLNPSFDGYAITDNFILNPPALATASYRLVPSVSTCGKLLYCRLTKISDGSLVAPGTINEAPVLYLNGVSQGAVRIADAAAPMLTTSAHYTFLIPLPSGVTALSTDTVTLSASAGWIFGPTGYAEAMSLQAVSNRVGRSYVRTADVDRTMDVGASFSFFTTPEWRNGFATKNQRFRCAFWVPANTSEDAGGMPVVMSATAAAAPVVNVATANNIDSTSYPTPTGYWAVRWDDLDGGTAFTLTANGDANGTVTEVTSLANPGTAGVGKVKVYDCQKAGSVAAFQIWLRLAKADRTPHFANLAVLAPGDFTWVAATPTVIPMPTYDELPSSLTAKMPTSSPFGPFRFANAGIELGDSAACQPEHLCEPGDFHWAQDVKTVNQIRFTSARPWANATSPYIYDPLFGTDYTATLAAAIVTTPAAGTTETITISDAATAPVLAGLVLTIGSEKMRVVSASGTSVVVKRGAESTTPALHSLGPITVSARRAMANLAAFGVTNYQVTELVTQSAHGLKTGQIVQMQGNGWMPFIYSDGRGFFDTWFNPYYFPVYVTGASTFVTMFTGPNPVNPANTTLSTTYTLDPANCSSLLYLPEYGGNPYEFAGTIAGKYTGAAAWLTFPNVASNDMVDAIWRRVLSVLPSDRDVWVELGDEPWNFRGKAARYWNAMDWQAYGLNGTNWYAVRVGQIKARGQVIWAAAGRDASKVKSSINVQTVAGVGAGIGNVLTFLASHGGAPDAVAVAPYYSLYPHASLYKAFGAWDTDMLADAWIWDFYDNISSEGGNFSGSQSVRMDAFKSAIDAWNASNGGSVGLIIYEYAPEKPWPLFQSSLGASMDAVTTTMTLAAGVSAVAINDDYFDAAKVQRGTWLRVDDEWMTVVSGASATVTVARAQGGTSAATHSSGAGVRNDWIEGIRDLTLHPGYRFAHYDAMAFFQSHGVTLCLPSALDQDWTGGNAWSDYHAIGQLPGKGDGTDGKADNRLTLARRGQANSKALTTNQDGATVSVRGQAFIDFLAVAPPTPTVANFPVLLYYNTRAI